MIGFSCMEALFNSIDRVRLHFINLQRFAEREKNLSDIVAPYFAYGGNQTRASKRVRNPLLRCLSTFLVRV